MGRFNAVTAVTAVTGHAAHGIQGQEAEPQPSNDQASRPAPATKLVWVGEPWLKNIPRPVGRLTELSKWNRSSRPLTAPARVPVTGGRNHVWSRPPVPKVSLFIAGRAVDEDFVAPPRQDGRPKSKSGLAGGTAAPVAKAEAGAGATAKGRETDLARQMEE